MTNLLASFIHETSYVTNYCRNFEELNLRGSF